jgi:hypothetical protein
MLLTVPEYARRPSDTIASDTVLTKVLSEILPSVAAAVEAAAGVRPVTTYAISRQLEGSSADRGASRLSVGARWSTERIPLTETWWLLTLTVLATAFANAV